MPGLGRCLLGIAGGGLSPHAGSSSSGDICLSGGTSTRRRPWSRKHLCGFDSQEVINDINRGTGGPNASIVHEILSHCNNFSSCSFVHERRNFNFEAHNLAKYACKLGIGRHVWLGTPHDPTYVPMTVSWIE